MNDNRRARRGGLPVRSLAVVNPEIQGKIEARAQQMTRGVFTFLENQRQENGEVFRQALAAEFMKNYVGAIVFEALKSTPGVSGETPSQQEVLDHVLNQFSLSKQEVQEAISTAFQQAMSTFAGRTIEYYCVIQPVPEMKSKSIN